MHRAEAFEPHHAVELSKHAVQVVHDVIARIAHVACIETDAKVSRELGTSRLHTLDDGGKLLKAAPHLSSFARHGLKKHARAHALKHHPAKHPGDELDAALHTLAHVRAGMEVVVHPR